MRIVKGVCPKCGREHIRSSPVPLTIVCPCYKICPICGEEMKPFKPDMNPKTYNITGEQEWTSKTLYYCPNHEPPYYSDLKPVEVLLT